MIRALVEGWRRAIGAAVLGALVLLALMVILLAPAATPGNLVGQLGANVELVVSRATTLAMDIGGPPTATAVVAIRELIGFGSALAVAYVLFWLVLSGGILDRLARARPVGTAHFFATCGVYMLRFLWLGILLTPVYFVIFRLVRPYVVGRAQVLAFVALLAAVNLVVDFAKVRAVVEDRRSMLSALLASLRFVFSRPIQTGVIYGVNLLLLVGLAILAARMLPSGNEPAGSMWLTFLAAQAVLFLRIMLRLGLMAGEVAYFQSELAHSKYTATPVIVWPDSPSVEAIQNLVKQQEPKPTWTAEPRGPEGSTW